MFMYKCKKEEFIEKESGLIKWILHEAEDLVTSVVTVVFLLEIFLHSGLIPAGISALELFSILANCYYSAARL